MYFSVFNYLNLFYCFCLTKSVALTIVLKGFPFHWEKSAELCLNFRITCLSWNREGKNQQYKMQKMCYFIRGETSINFKTHRMLKHDK